MPGDAFHRAMAGVCPLLVWCGAVALLVVGACAGWWRLS